MSCHDCQQASGGPKAGWRLRQTQLETAPPEHSPRNWKDELAASGGSVEL